jgi:hypothetical protein
MKKWIRINLKGLRRGIQLDAARITVIKVCSKRGGKRVAGK